MLGCRRKLRNCKEALQRQKEDRRRLISRLVRFEDAAGDAVTAWRNSEAGNLDEALARMEKLLEQA